CPPSLDPLNLICDHFFLTLSLPGGASFWQTHVGTEVITGQWGTSDNDFDLYIYRQSDGQQVASSASGGTVSEQVALQSPLPGTYEVRVVPFLVTLSDYAGTAQLFSVNQPPTQNPTFPTGGLAFSPATIVDPQRTEGEPLNHIDKYGNIWETGPWGFSTAQGFVARSTDNGDSFHGHGRQHGLPRTQQTGLRLVSPLVPRVNRFYRPDGLLPVHKRCWHPHSGRHNG